jgi:hypothetical protein
MKEVTFMKSFLLIGGIIVLGSLTFAGCSEDSECPTCPTSIIYAVWDTYDNFDDNSINEALWGHSVSYGGQVLETVGQLQVWGHTGEWTGAGIAWTIEESTLGWRFDLVEQYFDEGPSCQGWSIRATDSDRTVRIHLLNGVTAGCATSWNDVVGSYTIKHEDDSLAVYLNGNILRRLHDGGISAFKLEFDANNVYGSGDHSRIFIDDVERLELEG